LSPRDQREKGGVATVTLNLLTELARLDKHNRYLLYSYSSLDKTLLSKFAGRAINRVLPRIGFNKLWLKLFLKWDRPQVYLALAQAAPETQVPILGFVYDLAFYQYHDYPNLHKLVANTEKLVKNAQHLITISEVSKVDLERKFHLKTKQVSLFYPGVAADFSPQGTKFIDAHPYFLYVGALKRTKNIPQIITGFYQFVTKHGRNYYLILVGSDKDLDPEIQIKLDKYQLRDLVKIKGYVPSKDLPKYYRGAIALVSPSLVEGFGLPVAEAMACGTPVIVSHHPALVEVVDKAGLKVDEKNAAEIGLALSRLATNDTFRQKLVKLGLRQARKYSWHRFAKGVLNDVYKYCVPKNV